MSAGVPVMTGLLPQTPPVPTKITSSSAVMFSLLVIGLTVGFAGILAQSSLADVMGNWDERRCDIAPMFGAGFFKPKDDPRSTAQFSIDNFNFCCRKVVKEVLRTAFAPYYQILGEQVKGMDAVGGVMNSIRNSLKQGVDSFSHILAERYKVFISTYIQFARVFAQFKSAMSRVNAMMVSMVYIGLSTITGILNAYDFVVKVVIIILSILVALVILLFFIMIPVLPVILTTISVLIAAGLGGAVGGMSGAFCLSPYTLVKMADGSIKNMMGLQVGDILESVPSDIIKTEGENRVEGILIVDGSKTQLYSLDGISVSGDHRIFSNDSWILAKNHPNAFEIPEIQQRLVCLNTSHHAFATYRYMSKPVYVSDWQEVTTEEGENAWFDFVQSLLNPSSGQISYYPSAHPVASGSCKVKLQSGEFIRLDSLHTGMVLEGGNCVIGMYYGELKTDATDTEWLSDGVWVQKSEEPSTWELYAEGVKEIDLASAMKAFFPITESETFTIYKGSESFIVRDFTEVGVKQLEQSYSIVDKFLVQ